jgi:hypothetical protein
MTDVSKAVELLVGAHHRLVTGCRIVVYNQYSAQQGGQDEVDVIGVHTTDEDEKEIYSCEVVTHNRMPILHPAWRPDERPRSHVSN